MPGDIVDGPEPVDPDSLFSSAIPTESTDETISGDAIQESPASSATPPPQPVRQDHSALAVATVLAGLFAQCRIVHRRTMRQFAEQEIIIPQGPSRGERIRLTPWQKLWFDAVDSGNWRRFNITGVGQGGKTLAGSAIPVMYWLFEMRETVIYAAPTLEMAADKWGRDILPLIQQSRYADQIPDVGSGSRGGKINSIQFKDGQTLKFMTGGGSDKSAAGFTSKIVVITETDGMDDEKESSREADRITQLEARTTRYGDHALIFMECTTSIETGRTWRELKAGTDSHPILRCPDCNKWVTPEREQLIGWQDARDVLEARLNAKLVCPACGGRWDDNKRAEANNSCKLIHKGQTIDESGLIAGKLPPTNTFTFRFHCVHNPFVSIARIAEMEWNSPRITDANLAEKVLRQFWWTQPSESEATTLSEIDAAAILHRTSTFPRGRVPADAKLLTVGIDIGKWLNHWVAIAWLADGTPHIVEYGRIEVPSAMMAVEAAIAAALRTFRDETCLTGWPSTDPKIINVKPTLVACDARDWTNVIKIFCHESGRGFVPSQGHSIIRVTGKWASDPGYNMEEYAKTGVLPINADHWKSFVHARLQTPPGHPGGLTLFQASPVEHLSYAKHLVSEKQVQEPGPRGQLVTTWKVISRNNHFLDATAMACMAAHAAGIRLIPVNAPAAAQVAKKDDKPGDNPYLGELMDNFRR